MPTIINLVFLYNYMRFVYSSSQPCQPKRKITYHAAIPNVKFLLHPTENGERLWYISKRHRDGHQTFLLQSSSTVLAKLPITVVTGPIALLRRQCINKLAPTIYLLMLKFLAIVDTVMLYVKRSRLGRRHLNLHDLQAYIRGVDTIDGCIRYIPKDHHSRKIRT